MILTYGQTHQPFVDYGGRLLMFLTVIAISLNGIKALMESAGANEAIANLVNIILIWGIASFFLTSNVTQQIDQGFNQLAGEAAGIGSSGPEDAILKTMGRFSKTAMSLYTGPEQSSSTSAATVDTSLFDKATSLWKENIGSLSLGNIIMGLVNLLYKTFCALFVIITGLLFVGQFIITQVLVQIGFILMPIMVPWIVLEYTSFLFTGWMKFMISAGLTKVVGAILFGMSADLLGKITEMAYKVGADPLANFALYSVIMIACGLLAYLMLQAQSIAHGLMHGNAAGKIVAPRALSPSAASTSLSSGISRAGGSAASGAGRAASAVANKMGLPQKMGAFKSAATSSVSSGVNTIKAKMPGASERASREAVKSGNPYRLSK